MQFAGHRLAEIRRIRHKTREQTATAVHRSYQTIVFYEKGRVVPPGAVLGDLAEYLECEVSDFYEPSSVAA